MTGKIDPVAVRQEAQGCAARNTDSYSLSEWSQMHELYHLRKRLMHSQITDSESSLLVSQVRHLFLVMCLFLNSILAASIQY